jgi:hypothetical protein
MISIEQEITSIIIKRDAEISQLREDSTKKIVSMVNTAFINYQKIGEQLINIKNILPHGDFIPFITANCLIDVKQAQKLMKLYPKTSKQDYLEPEYVDNDMTDVQITQKPAGWVQIPQEVTSPVSKKAQTLEEALEFWGDQ